MIEGELLDLETTIKRIPGVLGCVILTTSGGTAEIQAFSQAGADAAEIEGAIRDEIRRRELEDSLDRVLVLELDATANVGDRETLERAAELAQQQAGDEDAPAVPPTDDSGPSPRRRGGRPPLSRVALTSSTGASQAEVALGPPEQEVVGQASGERTAHGLKVLAEATLQAVSQLVETRFTLAGASLITVLGREAVLVVVDEAGTEMVGAALVRNGPVTDAAVRATLDAVNRRIELLSR